MCTCAEMEFCFYKVWKDKTCSYRNISFDFIEDGTGDLDSLIRCSLDHLDKYSKSRYCTNTTNTPIYLYSNEIFFTNTEETLENLNYTYCFVAEMTKCLNYESCRIGEQNINLKNVHDGCASSHFRKKIESMQKNPFKKFHASAAKYDWFNLFERPSFKTQRSLYRNNGNDNGCGINIMIMLMIAPFLFM
uniref:Uncharacterized protein n=1 Tax=Panagrolaimus superbus TaxID=310955 RepID=A0A914YUX8_9BILA